MGKKQKKSKYSKNSGEIEVFKLQLPIVSNRPDPPLLAYNETRTREYEVYLPFEDIPPLFNERMKIYVRARETDAGFEILQRVRDQDW